MATEREAPAVMTRVLVVDDEAMIRWSIKQTLSAAGYEVAVAETGAEALRLFRQLHPDLVLLDVRLPDTDGFAILGQMKSASEANPVVIMMTAFDEDCAAARAVRLGAYEYLTKPFDFDELAHLVCKALEHRAR